MADDFEIIGKVVVDQSGAVSIQGINTSLGEMETKAGGVGNAFSNLGSIANFVWGSLIVKGVESAISAIGNFLSSTVQSAKESQDAIANVAVTIQSTGGAAGYTVDQLQAMATSLQGVTKFSDETILRGQGMLLTFTSIGHDVFPMATQAMLDLAQKMGTDVQGAAIQLGKALNDPVAGLNALHRVGVQFTDDQKEMIKQMVAAGDTAGAQGVILHELSVEFGGVAQAAGTTFSGQMAIAANKLDDFKELVGGPVLYVMGQLTSSFMSFANAPFMTNITAFLTNLNQYLNDGVPFLQATAVAFRDAFGIFDDPRLHAVILFFDDLVKAETAFQSASESLSTPLQAVASVLYDFKNLVPIFGDLSKLLFLIQSAMDGGAAPLDAITKAIDLLVWAHPEGPLTPLLKSIQEFIQMGQDSNWGVAIIDIFQKIFAAVFTSIGDAILGIDWKGLSQALATGIQGIDWASVGLTIGTVLRDVIGAILVVGNFLGQVLINIIQQTDWGAVMSALGSALAGLIGGVLAGLFGYANWDALAKDFINGFVYIGQQIQGTFQNMQDQIEMWWLNVTDRFHQGIRSITDAVTNWWNDIVGTFNSMAASFATTMNGIVDGIFNALGINKDAFIAEWQDIFTGIGQIVDKLVSNLVMNVSAIIDVISANFNKVKDDMNTVINFLQTTWQSFVDWFTPIWGGIATAASKAFNDLYGIVSGIATGIRDAVNKILDPIKTAINTWLSGTSTSISNGLNDAFKNIYINTAALVGIGRDIVMGIASGITGFAGHILQSITDAIHGLINKAKSLLGIASPSSVFAEIAKALIDGLISGWTSSIGNFMSLIDKWIGDIWSKLPDWLKTMLGGVGDLLGGVTSSGTVSGGTANHAGSGGLSTTPTGGAGTVINQYFYNVVNVGAMSDLISFDCTVNPVVNSTYPGVGGLGGGPVGTVR